MRESTELLFKEVEFLRIIWLGMLVSIIARCDSVSGVTTGLSGGIAIPPSVLCRLGVENGSEEFKNDIKRGPWSICTRF